MTFEELLHRGTRQPSTDQPQLQSTSLSSPDEAKLHERALGPQQNVGNQWISLEDLEAQLGDLPEVQNYLNLLRYFEMQNKTKKPMD
jgi:hypothetical protein